MPLLHPYYAAYALLVIGLFAVFVVVFFGVGAWRGVSAGIGATVLATVCATALVWYVVLPTMPDPPTSASGGESTDESAPATPTVETVLTEE